MIRLLLVFVVNASFCSFDDFLDDGIELRQNTGFLYYNIRSLMANNRLGNLQFNIDYLQKLMFHFSQSLGFLMLTRNITIFLAMLN